MFGCGRRPKALVPEERAVHITRKDVMITGKRTAAEVDAIDPAIYMDEESRKRALQSTAWLQNSSSHRRVRLEGLKEPI